MCKIKNGRIRDKDQYVKECLYTIFPANHHREEDVGLKDLFWGH